MTMNLESKDTTFWPWFAGFWEGEGSAIVRMSPYRWYRNTSRKPSLCGRIQVAQSVRNPLDLIKNKTNAGTIYFRQPKRRRHVPWNDKGTYLWSVDKRRDVLQVGRRLLPYLVFRKAEMQQLIDKVEAADSQSKFHHWTDNEIAILEREWPLMNSKVLSSLLGRKWSVIKMKAQKLGLKRNRWITRRENN